MWQIDKDITQPVLNDRRQIAIRERDRLVGIQPLPLELKERNVTGILPSIA